MNKLDLRESKVREISKEKRMKDIKKDRYENE